ncbi:MAG: hypothetical protein J3K34DRAFT_474552 [Monoraphidium minutum]|nr:MAG: hypothetical protein J3K34DRAFT_474552 [Monoraphidium minutum]
MGARRSYVVGYLEEKRDPSCAAAAEARRSYVVGYLEEKRDPSCAAAAEAVAAGMRD